MLKGYEKAAAVLSLLGDELSHQILSNLPEEMAVAIIEASNRLVTPTKEDLIEAVSEFNGYMQTEQPPTPQEIEKEEESALVNAEPVKQEVAEPATPLERIIQADSAKVATALNQERPEIAAYVLSHLPVEKIYEVLSLIGDMKESVESRLISIKDVPIAKELEEKILKNISERLI
jgi:flagellar motor switch protein FliG